MKDIEWGQPRRAATYLSRQVIGPETMASQPSIMFAESRRLSIAGDPGSITTDLLKIEELGITLGRVVSTGHEIELKDGGNFTFLLPSAGRLDILISGNEYRSIPGRPMAFRPTDRHTKASPAFAGKFRATTLQVSSSGGGEQARDRARSLDAAFAKDGIGLSGAVGRYLARELPHLVNSIFHQSDSDLPPRVIDLIGKLIDDQLSELIGHSLEQQSSRRILPAFHRVRQAEEIMHANSDEPLSIREIAEVLGVSLRSLQLAFAEVYGGLTPRDVLNRIRLEKARARLLAADGEIQVTTVAMDSGMFHLGRFSQFYARTFGEKPSETLLRRRSS